MSKRGERLQNKGARGSRRAATERNAAPAPRSTNGGGGAGNMGMVRADEEGWANITIAPFATLMLELDY